MRIFSAKVASLILMVLLSSGVCAQQIFKCKNLASGRFEFTNSPCGGATAGEEVRSRNNTIEGHRGTPASSRAPQRTQSDLQAERIDSKACESAKLDYDVTVGSAGNSKAFIEAKRSFMYGACGMREPNRTTTNINTRIVVR